MRTKFDTAEYGRTYGRGPRGLGNWAFRAIYFDDFGRSTESEVWFFRGLYTTAKRQAREQVKNESTTIGGVREVSIQVLP